MDYWTKVRIIEPKLGSILKGHEIHLIEPLRWFKNIRLKRPTWGWNCPNRVIWLNLEKIRQIPKKNASKKSKICEDKMIPMLPSEDCNEWNLKWPDGLMRWLGWDFEISF